MIVIAATNFPETLDKALVRPGRFDRHVTVLNPDVKGRQEILESHFKNVPRSSDVDLKVCTLGDSQGLITGAGPESLLRQQLVSQALQGDCRLAGSPAAHTLHRRRCQPSYCQL